MLPCWRGAPAHGEGEEPPCWSILCCGDRRGAHGGASGCAAAARLPLPVRTQQGAWDCRCLRRTGARVPGCRKEARGHGHASLGSAAMAAPAAAARPRSWRHGEQNGHGGVLERSRVVRCCSPGARFGRRKTGRRGSTVGAELR